MVVRAHPQTAGLSLHLRHQLALLPWVSVVKDKHLTSVHNIALSLGISTLYSSLVLFVFKIRMVWALWVDSFHDN